MTSPTLNPVCVVPVPAAVRADDPAELVWRQTWAQRPALRGRLHAAAAFVAPPAAALLLSAAVPGPRRRAAGVYGTSLCGLFAVSGTYHRLSRSRRAAQVLQRLDHSMIYLFIAGSWTPVAVASLSASATRRVLAAVWAAAVAASADKVTRLASERDGGSWFYPVLGSATVGLLRAMFRRNGMVPAVLFAAGGAVYLSGAAVFAAGRPNPWPARFGHHEIFHTAVVAGALSQYLAIWRLVTRP